jgi:hypothetical protein
MVGAKNLLIKMILALFFATAAYALRCPLGAAGAHAPRKANRVDRDSRRASYGDLGVRGGGYGDRGAHFASTTFEEYDSDGFRGYITIDSSGVNSNSAGSSNASDKAKTRIAYISGASVMKAIRRVVRFGIALVQYSVMQRDGEQCRAAESRAE